MPPPHVDHSHRSELERLLSTDAIVSHFQPIVDLDGGDVVAFEALARGPIDSPLAMPGDLFGTAERCGLTVELDWACRAAALRGALSAGVTRPTAIFVNIEPVAAAARIPEQYASVVEEASGDQLRVVFELTERALTERPGEVLRAVKHLRSLGAGIALDDVGVDDRSLALMPFLRPDVIKLDLSLIQGNLSPGQARTMHAVNAYAEQTGAVVLAEGIETKDHLDRALALGSRYGQGWLFGRPSAAPEAARLGALPPILAAPIGPAVGRTPFDRVQDAGIGQRTATKRLLLALSLELEVQAQSLGPEAVVLSNLQQVEHFTPATRARYRALASNAAFVGTLGIGVDAAPETGVRGGPLDPSEAMAQEWSVIVISPHFSAAMVARDLGDPRHDDMARRFEYCLTYDRTLVTQAARLMMARMEPPGAEARSPLRVA